MSSWMPLRTCIVCRKKLSKNGLIRMVKYADGTIEVDTSGKAQGRGCYVCNGDCLNTLIKKRCAGRGFRTQVKEGIYDQLKGLQDR